MSGSRRDDQKIGAIGELDVAGFPRVFLVLQRDQNRLPGERLEGEGSDEFASGLGHYRVDFVAILYKLGSEVGSLVSGDGSGDTEDDFHLIFNFQYSTFKEEELG
jgi:hypothetical protein